MLNAFKYLQLGIQFNRGTEGLVGRGDVSLYKFALRGSIHLNNRGKAIYATHIDAAIGTQVSEALGNKAILIHFDGAGNVGAVSKNDIRSGIDQLMRKGIHIAPVFAIKDFVFPGHMLVLGAFRTTMK